MYCKGMVVQFLENHKWRGSLGIITEAKQCGKVDQNGVQEADMRYMIAVPIPQEGTAYIFSMESDREFDMIGMATLVPKEEDNE